MKNNKNSLDEMQTEKRNAIGHQMFMLMFYALLLDSGLYGAGIHWLKYPTNIMIIIIICMSIYLIRTIATNAYLPPKAQNRKTIFPLIMAIAFSIVLSYAFCNYFKGLSAQLPVEDSKDPSALILFIVSATGLLISLLVAILKRKNDKKESDD